MNNADYWRGRFSILEDSAHREAQQTIQAMEEMYLDAQRSVQKEIESWYARFANNNQISLTDARKWLTAGQLEEFHWTVEQYIKIGEQAGLDAAWLKKLENASARFHISRLESVQMGIQQQLELLYGNQVDSLDALLKKVVGNGYTRTAFEVQKGVGLGWDITALNQKKLETLLSKPWTTDGRTFRDRCWLNKNDLVGSVSKSLTQGLLRGDSPAKITTAIQKQFGVHRYKAGRLVNTETTYFNAVATKESYKDLGVEMVEIIETLDSHTCSICGGLDGKVIPIAQYEPGVTVPPFHPNCVLPDTVIASPDGEAIMKSEYSGDIIEFTTANSRRLSVTPNHIMPTSRGWVRAKNLVQGDQIVYYCGWDEFIVKSNPAHDNCVPTVEKLFASLFKSCTVPPVSMPTTAKDLKGDAVENGKIDIIFIDSLLRDKLDPSTGKFLCDFPLIGTSEGGETTLSGSCSLAQFLMGIGLAFDGVMSGGSIASVLRSASLTHHQLVCLRRSSHYNARLQQTARNDCFGNRKFARDGVDAFTGIVEANNLINRQFFTSRGFSDDHFSPRENSADGFSATPKDIGDFCNAFPGIIEFDNIIGVNRKFYTGHVYDISSLSTLYICNGFCQVIAEELRFPPLMKNIRVKEPQGIRMEKFTMFPVI